VNGDDTIDGTLSVELYGSDNHYATSGESLTFSLVGNSSNVDAESSDTGDAADVSGTVTGNTMTIGGETGISVNGTSNSTSESYNSTLPAMSTGTFTLKFDVTANGDDVYIPRSVAAGASNTVASANPTAGFVVFTDMANTPVSATTSAAVSSSADTSGSFYVVHDGDTETFTVNVTIDPTTAGYYQVGLDRIRFDDTASTATLQTLDVDQTDSDFQTQQQYIH